MPIYNNILTVDDDVVLQLAISGRIQMMGFSPKRNIKVKTKVLVRAWLPRCDSSGGNVSVPLLRFLLLPLFLALCLEKAAVTEITAPPSCSTEENAAR